MEFIILYFWKNIFQKLDMQLHKHHSLVLNQKYKNIYYLCCLFRPAKSVIVKQYFFAETANRPNTVAINTEINTGEYIKNLAKLLNKKPLDSYSNLQTGVAYRSADFILKTTRIECMINA